MNELQPGTQIIYVPRHANGNESHRDGETGYVERDEGKRVLCRFWRKGFGARQLRTIANGEYCSRDTVIVKDTVPQEDVTIAQEQTRAMWRVRE